MKAKKGFNLRNVCGEHVVVADGKENIDFSKIINMNESSAYLWSNLQGKDFTVDDMVALLTQEYDVDDATAHRDSEHLMALWKEAGLLDEN